MSFVCADGGASSIWWVSLDVCLPWVDAIFDIMRKLRAGAQLTYQQELTWKGLAPFISENWGNAPLDPWSKLCAISKSEVALNWDTQASSSTGFETPSNYRLYFQSSLWLLTKKISAFMKRSFNPFKERSKTSGHERPPESDGENRTEVKFTTNHF